MTHYQIKLIDLHKELFNKGHVDHPFNKAKHSLRNMRHVDQRNIRDDIDLPIHDQRIKNPAQISMKYDPK